MGLNEVSTRRTYRLSAQGLFERESETTAVKRLFFLSVEGARTEKSYFDNLNRVLKELGVDNATIHVLNHPNDGLSSPQDVYALLEDCHDLRHDENPLPFPALEQIKREFSETEIERLLADDSEMPLEKVSLFREFLLKLGINIGYRKYLKAMPSSDDRFAIVFDRDRESHSRDCIEDVISKCSRRSFICRLTNPCFEFWLLMHLVDIKTLASPEQRGRIAVNVRVSKNHTYVSRLVSEIARHAKYISTAVFDRFYKCNLQKAMETASAFASRNEDIMNDIGTSIPVLLSTIFENTRSSAKEV